MNFPLPYLLDDGIGASTNNLNVLQLHQANTFMQPFDSPLHRFNQREVMIRQTRGSHQSRKTTTTADVGKAKVQSAKETMEAINPDVTVNTYRTFIDSENILDIIKDYDFVIDGTDNFPAKFLINDACVMAKKPFSHAGIIRFKGQLMTYVPGQGPCYRCVFKNPPPKDAVPTCKQAGVIGAMGGVIGSLQAMEAIKYILGVGDLLTGYLLTYDALKMEFRKIKLPSDTSKCPICGEHPTITKLIDYEQVECDGVHL